jgi:hypothetical protein
LGSLHLITAVFACVLAAGTTVSVARADGDPASDYLIGRTIFLPYDAKVPVSAAQDLTAAVRSANAHHFQVRVALIGSDYDLGSVTALWRKPRTYAHFLGIELSSFYKGRLLVVMPNGIGFYWANHPSASAYKLLAPVSVRPTSAGLATAATIAVRRLARAAGVTVVTSGSGSPVSSPRSSTHDGLVIALAVVLALTLGAAAWLLVRRRASRLPD